MLEQLKKIALFEFVDTEPVKEEVKEFFIKSDDGSDLDDDGIRRRMVDEEEEIEDESYEAPTATRMGSDDLLDNSGVMLVAAGIIILLLIVIFCVSICFRSSPRLRALLDKISKKILFNAIIRFFLHSNLKMQIGAATVLALTAESSTSAIVTLAIYNAIPILFGLITFALRS